jgi:hypothetical protein
MKIGQRKKEHKFSDKVRETIFMRRGDGSQVIIDIMKKDNLILINENGPTGSQEHSESYESIDYLIKMLKHSESYESIDYLIKTFEKRGFIADDITRAD